jgi:outer membrane autotransporter protein
VLSSRLNQRTGISGTQTATNAAAMSGTAMAALADTADQGDDAATNAMRAQKTQVWVKGFGGFGSASSSGAAEGFNTSYGGGAVGADTQLDSGAILGFAFAGTSDRVSLKGASQSSDITSAQFALYGVVPLPKDVMLDGTVIGGFDNYSTKRTLAVQGLPLVATSKHDGNSVALEAGVSRSYAVDSLVVTPRLGLSYANVSQGSYTESGAGALSLAVTPRAADSLRSHVGVTLSGDRMLASTAISAQIHLGWRHEFMDDYGTASSQFVGSTGPSFTTTSTQLGKDAAEFGLGTSIALPSAGLPGKASAFASYAGAASAKGTESSFQAGFRFAW